MRVDAYMQAALTDPEGGYYTTRNPLGRAGDFITSPEISQIFGELLGLWCVDVWQQSGMPTARLVELGPGRGTLMADALRAMRKVPGVTSQLSAHLLEINPLLREQQQEQLHGMGVPVFWHDTLAEALGNGPAFILANEFFDALPVRQYQWQPDGWYERLVGLGENDELCFTLSRQPVQLINGWDGSANPGDIMEVNEIAEHMVAQIAKHLAKHGGAALIVDYGYAEGHGDTLQAVKRHAFHPVLEAPGEADLTAHVDFAALAGVAERAGATTHGPVAQGAFLLQLGIELRMLQLAKHAEPEQQREIRAGVERLIAPEAMGSLFKVLALTGRGDMDISGFASL